MTRAVAGQPPVYIGEDLSGQWHDMYSLYTVQMSAASPATHAASSTRPSQMARRSARGLLRRALQRLHGLRAQVAEPGERHPPRAPPRLATRSTCARTRRTTTPTSSTCCSRADAVSRLKWSLCSYILHTILYFIELYCTHLFAWVITCLTNYSYVFLLYNRWLFSSRTHCLCVFGIEKVRLPPQLVYVTAVQQIAVLFVLRLNSFNANLIFYNSAIRPANWMSRWRIVKCAF